jgi:8-oxo-dGTP pyrophosphatase MutT (NUDIX family)
VEAGSAPPAPFARVSGSEVRAAGGVLVRPGPSGDEVLVVHRPRYDDWSLPKGKCEPGESDEDCARREVFEETGIDATLGEPLPEVRYRDHKNRPKVVRYWEMHPLGDPGSFTPNDEVDEIRWCPLSEVGGLLSYDHDRDVVTAFRAS